MEHEKYLLLLLWNSVLLLMHSYTADGQTRQYLRTEEQTYKQLHDTQGAGYSLYEIHARSKIHCSLMCLRNPSSCGCSYNVQRKLCGFIQSRSVEPQNGVTYMYKLLNPCTRDCEDILVSGTNEDGIYSIAINQTGSWRQANVFCEFSNGAAWTVILKRTNDSLPFSGRNWTEYKDGFGEPDGSFYLGNENMHDLTLNNGLSYELRVDLTDASGLSLHADYAYFAVEDEATKYRLILGEYANTSTVGDSFGNSNGTKFSTIDDDNDASDIVSCARMSNTGWWYRACASCRLTGTYGPNQDSYHRMSWKSWPKSNGYFSYASMKLKRISK